MNDLELEEQRMLASARRVFEPAGEDRQRVLAATLGALHAPPAPSELPPHDPGPVDVLWHAPGLATRLLVAAALSLGSGAVGYTLAERQTGTASSAATVVQPAAQASPTKPSAAIAVARGEDVARGEHEDDGPTGEARALRPTPAPRSRARADEARGRADTDDGTGIDEATLRLELDALRRAEAAQRAGRPGEVLSLLSELDRQVPGGRLHEERRAAYVIARCALGLGHPGMLARDFGDEFPDSVYEPRVRARCLQEAP